MVLLSHSIKRMFLVKGEVTAVRSASVPPIYYDFHSKSIQRGTGLTVKENAMVYHTLSQTTTFYPRDIRTVQWGKSKIPHNRSLVITLSNASVLTFDQMDYFGLQYMFDRLTDLLEKHKEEQ